MLGVFSLVTLLEISAWGHMDAFLPLFIERELGLPEVEVPFWVGVLAGAPLAVAVPLSPFWGVLADRYSRKLVILRVQVVAATSYTLAALCQDVGQMLGVRLLLGLSFGANAIMVAIIAGVVPERRVGLAIGLFQMMLPLGKAVGPLLGSGLISLFGLRGMFVADAVVTLVAFLVMLLLYREPPRRRDPGLGVRKHLAEVLGLVWKLPPLRLTFAITALFAGGNWLVTPYLPVLIARVYQGDDLPTVIGLVMGAYGGVAAVSAPLAGRLADRVGSARLVTLNMAGQMAMALGLMVAATPWQVATVVVLGAVPFGATNTTLYTHLARHTPSEHMGAVMSLTPMARNTAMLVGPLLGAGVSALGLTAVFATTAAVYGLAVVLGVLLARAGRSTG